MKILLIAYKIAPDKGSEDGTGYHLAKALLQKEKDITLLTRTNNIAALKADPAFADIDIIGVDVPSWLGFFKDKERGIILFYYLWQICVGLKVWRVRNSFDVIHQLNFHTTWAAHFLFSRKAKIIWGPITQHQPVPKALWFGAGYYKQTVRETIKICFRWFDPFLLWAALRSYKILYSAKDIVWPYRLFTSKIIPMTYAGSVFPVQMHPLPGKFNILFVGRFINLKGAALAMAAIRQFTLQLTQHDQKRVSVTIIGDGELHADVAAMSQLIMSAANIPVELLPWQDQAHLTDFYRNAAVFLYPSFEGQGLVVAEALSHGCPVMCFEGTAPHRLAGIAAITTKSDGLLSEVVARLSTRLNKLFKEYQEDQAAYTGRIEASFTRAQQLEWSQTADKILEAYNA